MTGGTSLSESMEMYLKAIYLIERRKRAARVTDIANELGVLPSSVTSALRALSKRTLINYTPYDIVTLTPQGRGIAEDIVERSAALRRFFINVLGVDEAVADSEACHMEHRMSDIVYDRLLHFVTYYESCPYEGVRFIEKVGYFCSRSEEACQHCELNTRPPSSPSVSS